MSLASTIPVTISEEAAARIAELGMQREFDMMIEHARHTAPGLRSFDAELSWEPEEPGHCKIVIIIHRDEPPPDRDDPTDRNWSKWEVGTFPPDVLVNFLMISEYEPLNGR